MDPKRILFILNHPDNALNFYEDLFNAICQKHQLHILSIKGEASNVLKTRGYKMHYFDLAVHNPLTLIRMILRIRSVIKSVKPDLVVGSTIRNTIFGNLVCDYMNIPTLSLIVGIGPLFESKARAYKLARLLFPYALKNTRHTFFFNKDDMRLFLKNKFITSDSYSNINGRGVNLNKFSPMPVKREGNFTFLMIARLLYDKGIREYVEAAKIVKSENSNVNFHLMGGFWDKNLKQNTVTREEMDRWIAEGYINYLGKVKDVRPFIAKSDCMVLPSYREGLSNVLMEGASMGKPLIASKVPGCQELVLEGINGYTFEARSTGRLVEAINKILSLEKKELSLMGEKSRALMIRKFDRSRSTSILMEKINEVLSNLV